MKRQKYVSIFIAAAITISVTSCSGNGNVDNTTAFDYEALMSSINEENENIQFDYYKEPAEYHTGEYEIGRIEIYDLQDAISGGPANSSGNYSGSSFGFQNTYYSMWLNGIAPFSTGFAKAEAPTNVTADEEYEVIIEDSDFNFSFKGLAHYIALSDHSDVPFFYLETEYNGSVIDPVDLKEENEKNGNMTLMIKSVAMKLGDFSEVTKHGYAMTPADHLKMTFLATYDDETVDIEIGMPFSKFLKIMGDGLKVTGKNILGGNSGDTEFYVYDLGIYTLIVENGIYPNVTIPSDYSSDLPSEVELVKTIILQYNREAEISEIPETTTVEPVTTTEAYTEDTEEEYSADILDIKTDISIDTTGVVDEDAIKALEAAKKGAEAIATNNLKDMLGWIYFPVYMQLCSGGTAITFEEEKMQEWFDLAIKDGRNKDQTWALNYDIYRNLKFYNPVRLTNEEIANLKKLFKETKLVGEPKSLEYNGYLDYEYTPDDKQVIYKVSVLGESISQLYATDETPYMYVVGLPEYDWDKHETVLNFKLDALMVYLEQGYYKLDELPEFEGRYKDGSWNEAGDKDNISDYIFIPFKDVFYKRQK